MSRDKSYIPLSDAQIKPLSERAVADLRSQWGDPVRFAHGQYWAMTSPGFYRPTHWLSRMSAEEAIRPSCICWGFHTTLCDSDAAYANGTLPLHILSNLHSYDLNSLSPRRRNKLRNCYKKVEFVVLCRPEFLAEDGYKVVLSSQKRTGYVRWDSRDKYQKYVNSFLADSRGVVVGGIVDGTLKALATCFAVGSAAYIDSIDISSDALRTNIGSGLVFVLAQMARRSGQVTELVNSPHTPERPTLTSHKVGMGFDLVRIPSRIWFMPPTEALVRRLKPEAHYRITGKWQCLFDQNDAAIEGCNEPPSVGRSHSRH